MLPWKDTEPVGSQYKLSNSYAKTTNQSLSFYADEYPGQTIN